MASPNHYRWLEKNYEKFCKSSGFTYYEGEISASGDKLSSLKFKCDELGLPFYKVAAIGLAIRDKFADGKKDEHGRSFAEACVLMYCEHPEWYQDCGGLADAIDGYTVIYFLEDETTTCDLTGHGIQLACSLDRSELMRIGSELIKTNPDKLYVIYGFYDVVTIPSSKYVEKWLQEESSMMPGTHGEVYTHELSEYPGWYEDSDALGHILEPSLDAILKK